jgi:alpha-2-macroglobulin
MAMKNLFQGKLLQVSILFLILACLPILALADDLTVYASRDAYKPGEPVGRWSVTLIFNNPVFPSNLATAIKVTADGTEEKFEIQGLRSRKAATDPGRTFRLVPTMISERPVTIKIMIEKGLSDVTGRLLLARDFSYQFLSIERISVSNVGTFFRSKTDKGLNLSLSGNVAESDLVAALKITPAVTGLSVIKTGGWGCRVTGNFEYDRDYLLEISSTRVNNGSALLQAGEFRFKGPGIKPEVYLKTERSVVELRGRQLFPVSLANVSKVRCQLIKVPPYLAPEIAGSLGNVQDLDQLKLKEKIAALKNLVRAAKISNAFSGEYAEDSDAFFAPKAMDHVYGYSLPLSFRKNPEKGGLWIAVFTDPDGHFRGRAKKLIQITDLSVSYKMSPKNLLLWVTSIHTGLPLSGVDICLSDVDGHKYMVGKTDGNGLLFVKDGQEFASLSGLHATGTAKKALSLAKLKWAVAATRSDASSIELDSLNLKPFSITQTKSLKDKPAARTGYIFTERGVYRPGDTVNFKFLSRDYKNNRIVSPAGELVNLNIQGPRGDILYTKELKLSEFGSCYDTFQVKSFFPVGTYTIKAVAAADRQDEFTRTFMVQEYKRPRHYVSLSIKRGERAGTEYVAVKHKDEFISVDVKGQYYTGGPVKNGRMRWKATLVPVANKVPGLDNYFFGNEDDKTLFLESGESTLDREGNLRLAIPLDPRMLAGIYGIKVSATVLDIDGEPATEVETFNPQPRVLVGISNHPRQVQTGYSAPLKIIAVDQNGKKLTSGKIEAQIMQKKYFYTQKRDEVGNLNSVWEEGWMKTLTSLQPIVNGEADFKLELNDSGDYLMGFTYEDKTGRYTSQTLFKVGWEDYDQWVRREAEKEVRTSNEVLLSMTKKEYRTGEMVRIQFHAPRPVKKCLVAIEKGGEILDYRVIDVKGNDGVHQFEATEKYQPNVYVSVLAAAGRDGYPIYSSQADTDIPTIYYGYADVTVRGDVQKLRLDISPETPELKGRPGEKKALTFKVADQNGKGVVSELAVCVVDEAVLALTRFQTPDLSALTKFNIPLAVFSGDLRQALVSQDLLRIFATKPLTGGGMGAGEIAGTVKLRKDFRPVAYFNPDVITDSSGRASVEFQLPDSTTAYRVYAVAADKGAGFVSGQRNMVVTKEFFIEPAVPRFLIPGDHVTFPIMLYNKTADKGDVRLKAEGSPDLSVRLSQSSLSLEPFGTSPVNTSVEVRGGAEKGLFRFQGTFTGAAGKYSDAVEHPLTIHSRYLPVNRTILGSFTERADISTALPSALKALKPEDINPGDFKANLSVSATNWTRIAPGLKYLLRYPYGCIEQTSSGVIPLAGIRDLVRSNVIPGVTVEQVDRFLKRGVERLLSMQLAGGGFSYWPGELNTSWWGTMYASFALITARQAGYEVPEESLKRALKFLHDNLFKKKGSDRYHGAAWTRELALFNLAMGKMLSAQDLEPFFQDYDSLNDQGKALLILSAKKVGYLPEDKLKKMIAQLNPRYDPSRTDYNNSSFRELAACLMAALEAGGAAKEEDSWAGDLLRGLKPDGRWSSTADTGWCLLALSKYYRDRETKKKIAPVRLRIHYGGGKPEEVTVSDATAYVELDPRRLLESGTVRVESESKTLLNYALSLTYPDVVTDPSQLTAGFDLRKKMENLNGKEEIRVGDVVRVTLDIGITRPDKEGWYGSLEYLALEDPVPAGLVPINSELKTEGVERQGSKRERDSWRDGFYDFTPTYFEFRDDGVRVFKNRAWTGSYRYSYLARAVAAGEFWMRGSRVSLMYDPDRFGKTLGKKVTILPMAK